jgi:hypothetical protein
MVGGYWCPARLEAGRRVGDRWWAVERVNWWDFWVGFGTKNGRDFSSQFAERLPLADT